MNKSVKARKKLERKRKYEMPITQYLERNSREYPNDVCLVEINPEIKEKAKKFKRWITKEVLPSIRKTGSYSVAAPQTLIRLGRNSAFQPLCIGEMKS